MISTFFAALVPVSWVTMVVGAIGFIVHLIIALTEAADKGEGGLLIFGILAVTGWGGIIGFAIIGIIAKVIEESRPQDTPQQRMMARRRGRRR